MLTICSYCSAYGLALTTLFKFFPFENGDIMPFLRDMNPFLMFALFSLIAFVMTFTLGSVEYYRRKSVGVKIAA